MILKKYFFRLLLIGFTTLTLTSPFLLGKTSYSHHSTIQRFLRCFLMEKNFKKIMSMDIKGNQIPSVNGIRALSAICACLVHAMWFQVTSFDNIQMISGSFGSVSAQLYQYFTFGIDVFFVLRRVFEKNILIEC